VAENSEDTDLPVSTGMSDADLIERFRGYGIDRDRAAHFRGRLERRLLIDRCADCGRWHQPPRPMCPACWSWNVEATEVSGRGTIHLLMQLHQGPPATGVDYADGHPVVTVELEEQEALRFTSTVIDTPAEEIRIGTPVELDWIDRDGTPLPVFRARQS
jgi:uncharacterized OB-fold protein